jgi:hypothetical protein
MNNLELDLDDMILQAAPEDEEDGEDDGGYYPMLISAE